MNTFLILLHSLIWIVAAYVLYQKYAGMKLVREYTALLIYRILFLSIQIILFYRAAETYPDVFNFNRYLGMIYSDGMNHPAHLFSFISGNYIHIGAGDSPHDVIETEPRVAFFLKVLLPFFILSGGNYVLCCLWITLLGTYCFMQFYVGEKDRTYRKLWWLVACVPSFTFWSVGILKEAFVIPVLFLLFSYYRKAEDSGFKDIRSIGLFVLVFWISWNVKYYYAALFFILCAGFYYIARVKQSKYSFLVLGGGICTLFVTMGLLHPNLNISRIAKVLYENSLVLCNTESGSGCVPFTLDGTWLSVVKNIPTALWYSIYIPAWNQVHSMTSLLAAIESYTLVALLMYMLFRWITKKIVLDKRDALALLFIAAVSTILILSSPNPGTFSRYRIAYLPLYCFILFKYTIPAGWFYSERLK